ncbi:MAG: aldose 1-epimerase family protein [Bacteroidales bacterium]|nr:aldose 1-epimerase family protein [Bacteroidales bacterium]
MKRKELLEYIGNLDQIGGTRHYELTDGRGRNLRAIDINSGSGLHYTVLPDRGMDISLASFRGVNLAYISCTGETHPAFYEPENAGWLRTFTGGLLTTCGLTYLGPPVKDQDEDLGLHGRYSTLPAKQVADLSQWQGDEFHIKLRGTVEEAVLFGKKIRLEREISTVMGQNKICIADRITNFGYTVSPFTVLYHMNLGYPLLSEDSELVIDPEVTIPRDDHSASGIANYNRFIKPQPGFVEQVYFHKLRSDENGRASLSLLNRKQGIELTIEFTKTSLPWFTQWKMMGQGEYVLGLEPGNVPVRNRKVLREEGLLPLLQPGETITSQVDVIVKGIN